MSEQEPGARILVAEDDPSVARAVVRGLRHAGFEVELVSTGDAAIARALAERFELVVLDLMLPGADGFEVLARLRPRSAVPVLVLSARNELPDRLRTFELGAVDFVPKPFWIEELVARIRAKLRVAHSQPARVVAFDAVRVDLDARAALVEGVDAKLTRAEFDVLAYLVERPGRAVTRDALVEALRGDDGADARTVDSHVARIRRKLGEGAERVVTVWGVGYRFEPPAR